MVTVWTVEAGPEPTTTTRFADAVREFDAAPAPKRLLRNGRPLRVQTNPDQLDLFEESA